MKPRDPGASQVWRFLSEAKVGDHVITYSPAQRTHLIGRLKGEATTDPQGKESGMSFLRATDWLGEVSRDSLTTRSRNTLGSTLTIFRVPESAGSELLKLLEGKAAPAEAHEDDEELDEVEDDEIGLREDVAARGMEFINDKANALDWEEMQELVAGLLRGMGYKTRVSPSGPDRGKDIVASPDGFGFDNPRIVVEVKHRGGGMSAKEVRSFLGGRHPNDRGLYVSTGGFTKDAYYEAERASIPLMLMDLDDLVRAVVENYESLDTETKHWFRSRKSTGRPSSAK
jgi:restriction system protein